MDRGQKGPAKLPFPTQPANQAWLQQYMTLSNSFQTHVRPTAPVFHLANPGHWLEALEQHNCASTKTCERQREAQARNRGAPRVTGSRRAASLVLLLPVASLFLRERLCALHEITKSFRSDHPPAVTGMRCRNWTLTWVLMSDVEMDINWIEKLEISQ